MTDHLTQKELTSLIRGENDDSVSRSHELHLSECTVCQNELDALAANQQVWGMAANFDALSELRTNTFQTENESPPKKRSNEHDATVPQPISSLPKKAKPLPAGSKQIQSDVTSLVLVFLFALAIVCSIAFLRQNLSSSDNEDFPSAANAAAKETLEQAHAAEQAALEQAELQRVLRSQNGSILNPPLPPPPDGPP